MSSTDKERMSTDKDKRVRLIGILAAAALVISLYLTKDHYEAGSSLCDASEMLSCSVVNRSTFSELLGVPVSIFGAIWCCVLCFGSWRVLQGDKPNYYLTAILLWSFLGVLFIFYMVIAEIILQAICIFCTMIHILTIIIFYQAVRLFRDMQATPPVSSFLYNMRYILLGVFVACIVPVFIFGALKQPDEATILSVTDFAVCVTSKHIKMYGSDGCGHCQHQKSLFGKEAFAYIDYVDCSKPENGEECKNNNIGVYPTWIKFHLNGVEEVERVKGVQSLDSMEKWSGCVISHPSASPPPSLSEA